MRKNKKGFTLTEIIAAIVILGVIVIIAIPSVNSIQKKFKNNYYVKLDDTIVSAAKTYLKDNEQVKPNTGVAALAIKYSALTKGKYLEDTFTVSGKQNEVKGYNDSEKCEGFTSVLKINDNYTYENCMVCTDNSGNKVYKSESVKDNYTSGSDASDSICGLYDNINDPSSDTQIAKMISSVGNNDPVYFYKDESITNNAEVIREALKVNETVTIYKRAKDESGNFITENGKDVIEGEYEVKTDNFIYPSNVTNISLNKINGTNNSFTPIKVKYVGEKTNTGAVEKDVYIYEYPAPIITSGASSTTINSKVITLEPSSFSFNGATYPNSTQNIFAPGGASQFDKYQYLIKGTTEWKDTGFTDGDKSWIKSFDFSEIKGKEEIKFRYVTKDGKYSQPTDFYEMNIKYTVSYDANGGENAPAPQTKTHGINLTLNSTKPTWFGHDFMGWAEPSNKTTAIYNKLNNETKTLTYTKNENITLYAVWRLHTYAIKYDANGGTGAPAKQNREYGTTIKITTQEPTRDGYDFQGWTKEKNSTTVKYKPGQNYSENNSYTFYAVWKVRTYTISYDANGGENAPASQTKTHGVNLTLSSTKPTRTGYIFRGWSTDKNATTASYPAGGTFTPNENKTLYAVWEVRTYTISYDANGGSGAPGSQTKTHGVSLTLSSTKPTRDGYDFQGWSTDKNATTASYSAGGTFTPNGNKTLYAVWKLKTYIVKYDANGGSGAPGSQTKNYGTNITLSSTKPTRSGCEFIGWGTSSTATTVSYKKGATYKKNENITLYAIWQVTVTFNKNGGDDVDPSSKNVIVGSTYGELPTVNKDGYFFKGWYTEKKNGSVVLQNTKVTKTSNHTLYAQWDTFTYASADSCENKTLSAGVYWLEIIGGGASSVGTNDSSYGAGGGGNAARFAGYIYLPADTYKFCPGDGGDKGISNSAVNFFLGVSTPHNGGNSYIQNKAGQTAFVSGGGITYKGTASEAKNTYGNGIVKLECDNQVGTACGDVVPMQYGRGCKYTSNSYTGFHNGYDGGKGYIYYERKASLSEWNSNSSLRKCRSTPKCSARECGWVYPSWQ